MNEKWRDNYEKQRSTLLDKLDTVFEAASLNYTSNEKIMVDWLHGEIDDDISDNVLRVLFANWANKRKVYIEKPILGASGDAMKSIFADEKDEVAFIVNITDLLDRYLDISTPADIDDSVECLQAEIYKDGRIALIYLGTASADEESIAIMNGFDILGVNFSEQGFETHEYMQKLILDEFCFDYWASDFEQYFSHVIDDYNIKNNDNL